MNENLVKANHQDTSMTTLFSNINYHKNLNDNISEERVKTSEN